MGEPNIQYRYDRRLGWCGKVHARQSLASTRWLPSIIVRQSLFLAGPFTNKAAVGALRLPRISSTLLSFGLEIRIRGLEQLGRKAKDWRSLIADRRTLLVLDGLEPLQNPPGPQEGRLRDSSLQALLRELAAFNKGLCVITTRLPIADIADHERTSASRRDLEQLTQ